MLEFAISLSAPIAAFDEGVTNSDRPPSGLPFIVATGPDDSAAGFVQDDESTATFYGALKKALLKDVPLIAFVIWMLFPDARV